MDGILNVLKPPGMTSHDMVAFIRRLVPGKKAGHTGTLDPGAAGVLPVCLGRATRIIQFLPGEKAYRAETTFGRATDTGDAFGRVVYRGDATGLTRRAIEEVLQTFCGQIRQVPPMTSAVHYAGKKLYQLARQGLEVERQPRLVTIHSLRLVRLTGEGSGQPKALVDVVCSAGTYIRTLIHDLGERLGCGAYMSFLLRIRAGPFSIHRAVTLEEVADMVREGNLAQNLVGLKEALGHMPAVQVQQRAVAAVRAGRPLYWPGVGGVEGCLQTGGLVRLTDGTELLAVARAELDPERAGRLKFLPVRVLV
ncbi:tRNA pseudouridine(55) synthase TruB [Desulfofundulus thermobenzoicus]|uniref:tRNA pseudouridine synthase B n=1 Tax=Desulfofundulus thermobenzoicus TaxID=29376 RepID=A0A6N7IQX9_9FIRM|nr:tRNA pseudouridine(55) synthase TruB [Desulfofundulus thermobenzoicus]MQL52454.1 tRNA pseudouridine(55) synthase TruB [Desulfofundulus thermobenzoicus]